jgi:hypothetical protein
MNVDYDRDMSNATTIVPIGNFTPALARRVREMAIERAQRRAVVISMHSTRRYSWSALCDLAAALRATITPYPIRLARALPRTRALFGELGIQHEWFVEGNARASRATGHVRDNRTVPDCSEFAGRMLRPKNSGYRGIIRR